MIAADPSLTSRDLTPNAGGRHRDRCVCDGHASSRLLRSNCSRPGAPRPGPAGDVQRGPSPVGVDMHLEMAHFLISTRLLKIISSRYAENAKRQENRHFQMSKAISTDMKAGSTVGHRERTCGRVEPSSDETLTRIPLASARTPSRHTASSTSWPRLNRYGLKPQTALAYVPAASSAERPERQKSPFVLVISPRPKQKPSSTRCSTPASITSTPRSITG